jgi:hypothetical protein
MRAPLFAARSSRFDIFHIFTAIITTTSSRLIFSSQQTQGTLLNLLVRKS